MIRELPPIPVMMQISEAGRVYFRSLPFEDPRMQGATVRFVLAHAGDGWQLHRVSANGQEKSNEAMGEFQSVERGLDVLARTIAATFDALQRLSPSLAERCSYDFERGVVNYLESLAATLDAAALAHTGIAAQ